MRALTRPLVAGALAAGAVLATSPADAACFGTASTVLVCATLPTVYQTEIKECVYIGGDTCENVTVPFVGVSGSTTVTCGGNLFDALVDTRLC